MVSLLLKNAAIFFLPHLTSRPDAADGAAYQFTAAIKNLPRHAPNMKGYAGSRLGL